jgi:hypothetical protein
MGEQGTERDRVGQQHRRVVGWGSTIDRTAAGAVCQGCADQGELLTWADSNGVTRRTTR